MDEQERLTQLELKLEHMNYALSEIQKERKEDNERFHNLDLKVIEIQYDTKLILKSLENIQKSTEENNASFSKRIEALENSGNVSIMKDLIKPLLVGSLSGGGLALIIKDYISK